MTIISSSRLAKAGRYSLCCLSVLFRANALTPDEAFKWVANLESPL
jgi:hypothetical protein